MQEKQIPTSGQSQGSRAPVLPVTSAASQTGSGYNTVIWNRKVRSPADNLRIGAGRLFPALSVG